MPSGGGVHPIGLVPGIHVLRHRGAGRERTSLWRDVGTRNKSEGNPLTTEEIAMFEMFEREGWSPERRRAHILRRIEDRGRVAAAE